MTNEYKIQDIGYAASIWQGEYNFPLLVCQVSEVINIPNTIEMGGINQSLFFGAKENVDVKRFNEYNPNSQWIYKLGKLPISESERISHFVKVSPKYLSSLDVLFRFNTRVPESPRNSSVPVQNDWSFDTTKVPHKWINAIPESIVNAPYILLLDADTLNATLNYFETIQQNTSTLQPLIVVDPSSVSLNSAKVSTVTPPIPQESNKPTFRPPVSDMELYAEEQADKIFSGQLQMYSISSLEDFNSKLRLITEEKQFMARYMQESNGTLPFSDMIESAIRIKTLLLAEKYIYQQLALLSNRPIASDRPDMYSVDSNGDIALVDVVEDTIPIKSEEYSDHDEFDDILDDLIDNLTPDSNGTYCFKKISRILDYSSPVTERITRGAFRCGDGSLDSIFTSSNSSTTDYFVSVNDSSNVNVLELAYCHSEGLGSIGGYTAPSKMMYSKYSMNSYGNVPSTFTFKNGIESKFFYVLHFNRNVFNDGIDVGNFQITLSPLVSNANQLVNTGSNFYANPTSSIRFHLIDDSSVSEKGKDFYYLVSGSLRTGIYDEPTNNAWGIVYPKQGIVIFDGNVLDVSCSFNTVTASISGDNPMKLFKSISGSIAGTVGYTKKSPIFVRSYEDVKTETYFCRAEMNEFNYSTNITYSDYSGSMTYPLFKNNPTSYVTSIGLYNRRGDLLAIGKMPNPVKKDSNKVLTFQVKVRLN
jgi:hypothetical protein